jgi:uncharacterized caspase-like protein
MFRAVLRNTIVAAGLVLGSHAALAESRVALVIGQSAYRAVTTLPNPANDARAIAQLLGDAGFEVTSAADLTQNELRERVSEFAAKVAAKGPDTVALMFYAGHGVQIDGENYLIPVELDPKREADIPLQAVRLNDILNTLTSVPSKTRLILLDSCRNNPFPEISKTTGHGLAVVDAKLGAPGTFLSYSTSPGAEAEDGNGANSPYTTALLKTGREPGLPVEEAFKRVRLAVNQVTEGRQTPWDSSSLISDFRFFGQSEAGPKQPVAKRTVEQWRAELKGKPIAEANDIVVSDGSGDAYEAFVGLYTEPPFGPQARAWLDRHRRMIAWNNAVIANTGAAYRAFLADYPDSDLTATAVKLEERMRNRLQNAAVIAAPVASAASVAPAATAPGNVALTCPCGAPPAAPALQKKLEPPKAKRVEREPPPKRVVDKPARRQPRGPYDDDDVVVVRRPPPVYYDPSPGPVIGGSIGIGGRGIGGGGLRNSGRGGY